MFVFRIYVQVGLQSGGLLNSGDRVNAFSVILSYNPSLSRNLKMLTVNTKLYIKSLIKFWRVMRALEARVYTQLPKLYCEDKMFGFERPNSSFRKGFKRQNFLF